MNDASVAWISPRLSAALVVGAVLLLVAGCDNDAAAPRLPAKLAFTSQPRSATAGASLGPVALTVVDANDVAVPGGSDTVTVALAGGPAGAVLAGTVAATTVSGIAAFGQLSVAKAGSYTLVATAPGLGSAVSAAFTISPGAAARLAFLSAPAVAQGQVPISPAVQVAVEDSLENTVTSATGSVTLALGTNPNSGTLSGTATATVSGGIAAFAGLSIDNPAHGYTLVATSGALPADTSAPFAVHVTFATLSAGGGYACGVTPAGAAYCWGANTYGQLGNGSTTNSTKPAAVHGGLQFTMVRAGLQAACGLAGSGTAYCWGYNADGELGNGGTANASTPTAVSGGLAFASLTSGAFHVCGLTTTGAAYCWGGGTFGQLGNGATSNSSVPVAVSGGLTFSALAGGGTYTCALTALGAAYCWGYNASGQLGNGTTTSDSSPVAVTPVVAGFAALTAGLQHACGLTANFQVYCWGYNGDGEFGDSVTTSSSTPVLSSGSQFLGLTAISAGQNYTCGLSATGTAYCWGANQNGMLGDGSSAGSLLPVAVLGGHSFKALATGPLAACGLTAAGAAYCWGYNGAGMFGNGTFGGESFIPVPVTQ